MKSHYRPHKMALWNNLVPDLVKLSEREIEEADKYPHHRFPSPIVPYKNETSPGGGGGSKKDVPDPNKDTEVKKQSFGGLDGTDVRISKLKLPYLSSKFYCLFSFFCNCIVRVCRSAWLSSSA